MDWVAILMVFILFLCVLFVPVVILMVVILFLCVLFVPYDNWLNMAARKLASKMKQN